MNHWHPSQTVLGLILLAGTVLVSLLVWTINRRAKPAVVAEPGERTIWNYLLSAVSAPLQFAIWYYGAFFGLPLLLHWIAPQWEAAMSPHLRGYFWHLGLIISFFWFLYRMVSLVEDRLAHRAAHTPSALDDFLFPVVIMSLRTFIPLIGLAVLLQVTAVPPHVLSLLRLALAMGSILAVGVICNRAILVGEKTILARVDLQDPASYDSAGVQTRVRILRKFAVVFVWLLVLAGILMLFQEVRTVGKSLLASAGLGALALTFAANQSLSTLFAGLQIAFTQPIRLGDRVIVQGEFGFIEEITFTFVVVRTWDLRRLVVPINFFIQQPFQNWSRGDTQLATVFIRVDFTAPVEELRRLMGEWLKEAKWWDGQTYAMHVTGSDAVSMELRVIASGPVANGADLQYWIRERLLTYLRDNYPDALPQARQININPTAHQKPPAPPA
ncbi:MAG: mechanosensitive ion channel [Verrucomicrobium sp.]|nr:mechanosensitive ion channel [Verrucomicrobium sp.]